MPGSSGKQPKQPLVGCMLWDVPKIMQTKFLTTVIVFGVVSSEGHVMPPYIFQKGLKINTVEYLKVLEMNVLPWIRKVAAEKSYA